MSLPKPHPEPTTSRMFQSRHRHSATYGFPVAILLVSSFLSGCGDDGGDGPGAAGSGGEAGSADQAGSSGSAAGRGGSGEGGSGDGPEGLYGSFEVTLKAASSETGTPASTGFIGRLYAGATPVPMTLKEQMEVGACKLLTPSPVFCSPTCTGGAVCVSENNCAPFPAVKTAGMVTLTGLGSSALPMEPRNNTYQLPAGTTLPYPPCTQGAEVKLDAAGGESGPFALTTACIAPLEATATVKIVRGQALMLRWNAPADSGKSRIAMVMDLSQHGTSKGRIECEVPDTGSYAIVSRLIDALLELGLSGFPYVEVTRESVAPAQKNLTLDLKAPLRIDIEIDGLTSCMDDDDCPAEQTCQADLKCE